MKSQVMRSENILKVIDNFKKLPKHNFLLGMITRKGRLNMLEAKVNENHKCGTVHCHGGWYAVATCNLRKGMRFDEGANQMARDLGFFATPRDIYLDITPMALLVVWADKNPELWGNKNGLRMFGNKNAFESKKRRFGALTLQHIIDHWQEVYLRVKTKELLSEPPVDTLIANAIKKANIPAPKEITV